MSAVSRELRREVGARAGTRCEYCLLPAHIQSGSFPVDHILPHSRGGETELGNLALACPQCNEQKWAHVDGVDPVSGQTVSLFNPRDDRWGDHFRWSADEPMVFEGRTLRGRATIERLQMNHPEMVALRRFLANAGIAFEPPA